MIKCVSVLSESVLMLVLEGSENGDNCTVVGDRMILQEMSIYIVKQFYQPVTCTYDSSTSHLGFILVC